MRFFSVQACGILQKLLFRCPVKAKLQMCALEAALFSLQRESFSCRDAHSFNRLSHRQGIANMRPSSETQSFRKFPHIDFAYYSPLRACPCALSLGKRCRSRVELARRSCHWIHTQFEAEEERAERFPGVFEIENGGVYSKMFSPDGRHTTPQQTLNPD